MKDIKNDQLIAKRLIEQTLTNWVNPELEKRKSDGQLKEGFKLKAAQVIFSVGGPPEVRVNGEVKVIAEAKLKRPIKKGEKIFDKDIEDVRSIRLTNEEKDFGHITIVRLSKGWVVGFSFIYDVSKAKELYDVAMEFMKSAHGDLQKKRYRPFIEALSVAIENLAKARIYLLPDKEIRKAKTHRVIQAKVNRYARTNSVIKLNQKDVFNELLRLRDKARYNPKFTISNTKASSLFDGVKSLSKEVFRYLVQFGEHSS